MKSNLFSKNVIDKKALTRDIGLLLKHDDSTLRDFPSYVFQIVEASTNSERRKVLESIAPKAKLSEADMLEVVSIVHFFLENLSPEEDGFEDLDTDLIDDLVEMEAVDGQGAIKLVEFFKEARKISESQFFELQKGRVYEQGCFPSLKGIATTIDYRATFSKEFNSSMELESYNPEFKKLVTIASIRLKIFESGSDKTFAFQANKKDLKWLITSLEAQLKQLEVSESTISEKGLLR